MNIYYDCLIWNGGKIYFAANEKGLIFVGGLDKSLGEIRNWYEEENLIKDTKKMKKYSSQLEEYFQGKRREFTFELELKGTNFQKMVWNVLLSIPYGSTKNYSQIAEKLGSPGSRRAVATAIGKNPVLLVVPCHRVVQKNGELGGYRGGYLMKKELKKLEENG